MDKKPVPYVVFETEEMYSQVKGRREEIHNIPGAMSIRETLEYNIRKDEERLKETKGRISKMKTALEIVKEAELNMLRERIEKLEAEQ